MQTESMHAPNERESIGRPKGASVDAQLGRSRIHIGSLRLEETFLNDTWVLLTQTNSPHKKAMGGKEKGVTHLLFSPGSFISLRQYTEWQ